MFDKTPKGVLGVERILNEDCHYESMPPPPITREARRAKVLFLLCSDAENTLATSCYRFVITHQVMGAITQTFTL
jgi:hypothetical protein